MKERPILMKGAMVRATLEDRKTQTRRVAKERDGITVHPNGQVLAQGGWLPELCCPYGVPGDRLWVKETWCAWDTTDDEQEANEVAGNVAHLVEMGIGRWHITYRADPRRHAEKWRPAIFMPRWASRITLEIESVRVERLIEISEEDAMAEGVVYRDSCWYATDDQKELPWMSATGAYMNLWESINGPGSWDANPWVWVIQFRRIKP